MTEPLELKVGNFYIHDKGRCIAVRGVVPTYKWGDMLIIEETDGTGHGISCVDKVHNDATNWTEIGEMEFLKEFNNVELVQATNETKTIQS